MKPQTLLALAALLGVQAIHAQQRWDFEATLDGKPIGEHRFTLEPQPDGTRLLRSQARFDVRVLGVRVYRYRHDAQERWQGDCLQSIQADTDDNGQRHAVQLAAGDASLASCAMSFAYWNPAILKQTKLLNAQTGEFEPVTIEPLAPAALDVRGQAMDARRWRIAAPGQRIDLWYDPAGHWLALDATLASGRQLSYRPR